MEWKWNRAINLIENYSFKVKQTFLATHYTHPQKMWNDKSWINGIMGRRSDKRKIDWRRHNNWQQCILYRLLLWRGEEKKNFNGIWHRLCFCKMLRISFEYQKNRGLHTKSIQIHCRHISENFDEQVFIYH